MLAGLSRWQADQVLECLVTFLILWVALIPDRLGYGEGGGSRRSKPAGTPPPTPAKTGVVDSTAISAIRNVPCVTNLVILASCFGLWRFAPAIHVDSRWLEDIPPSEEIFVSGKSPDEHQGPREKLQLSGVKALFAEMKGIVG